MKSLSVIFWFLLGLGSVELLEKKSYPGGNNFNEPYLLFEENFEGNDPLATVHNIETGMDHSLTVVPEPLYPNNHAARFELRESDPLVKRGSRAEITIVKGEENQIPKNTWYSFDVYFPSDGYKDEEDTDLINQWHQEGTPSSSIRIKNGRFQLKTGNLVENRKTIDLGKATKDRWHNFVIHFIHSDQSDGLIELWLNDEKLIERKGGNMYEGHLPKWKLGIYKSTWNDEKTTTDKRVLYFDNIKVGNENSLYEGMKNNSKAG